VCDRRDTGNLKVLFFFQGVQFKSVKKKKGMTVGFVTFENAEQLKTAQEVCPVYCVCN